MLDYLKSLSGVIDAVERYLRRISAGSLDGEGVLFFQVSQTRPMSSTSAKFSDEDAVAYQSYLEGVPVRPPGPAVNLDTAPEIEGVFEVVRFRCPVI